MPKAQPFDSLEAADARFLRRLLLRALRNALAGPLASAVALSACAASPKMDEPFGPMKPVPNMPKPVSPTPVSPTPISPKPTPLTPMPDPNVTPRSFTFACDADGNMPLVPGMMLAYDVDYLADVAFTSVFSERGERCASAQDPGACSARVDAANSMLGRHLLTVEGDQVRAWVMPGALSLLGDIDTAEEALWIAINSGYIVSCGTSGTSTDAGYRIADLTLSAGGACAPNLSIDTIVIGPDADIDVLDSMPLPPEPTCAVGRRPPGLRSAHLVRTRCALGEHFARAAHMEAASVPAFAAIARDLAAQRAPLGLRIAAERARRDEVRHARMMARLARRFGVAPVRPVVARSAVRSRLELALDNAIEGCVNETYAALEATHQAAVASDPQVRAVHARIAADETRHAAFSFALQRWLVPQLGASDQERVSAARERAVVALGRTLERTRVPRSLQQAGGLPAPETALALHATLARSVWS
jgi:hypothetical protein